MANMGDSALGRRAVREVVAVVYPHGNDSALADELANLAPVAVDFSYTRFPITPRQSPFSMFVKTIILDLQTKNTANVICFL